MKSVIAIALMLSGVGWGQTTIFRENESLHHAIYQMAEPLLKMLKDNPDMANYLLNRTKPAAAPVAPQTRLDKLRAQGKCKDGGNVAPECFDGPRGEIEAKARRECLESGRNEEVCGVKDAIIYQGWKKCTAASEIGCEMHPEREDSTVCREVRANSQHPDKSTEPPRR